MDFDIISMSDRRALLVEWLQEYLGLDLRSLEFQKKKNSNARIFNFS